MYVTVKKLLAFVLLYCVALQAADIPVDGVMILGNSVPLYQTTGDVEQQSSIPYGGTFGFQTNTLAATNYGVLMIDEGPSVQLVDGRTLTIYGDTVTVNSVSGKFLAYQTQPKCPTPANTTASGIGGGYTGGTGNCLGPKAVSLIPASPDFSGCNVISTINDLLAAGTTPVMGTNWDWSLCPKEVFVTDSAHLGLTPIVPAAVTPIIHGMGLDVCTSTNTGFNAGNEPTGLMTDAADHVDMFAHINNFTRSGSLKYIITSTYNRARVLGAQIQATSIAGIQQDLHFDQVVTNSCAPIILSGTVTTTGTAVHVVTGPTILPYMVGLATVINDQEYRIATVVGTSDFTVSASAGNQTAVAFDIDQNEATNTGKYIHVSPVTFDPTTVPWQSLLPPALQTVAQVDCLFGTSWLWRHSNLYLACIDHSLWATSTWSGGHGANGAAGGLSNMWYLVAGPSGTNTKSTPQPVTWQQGAFEQNAAPLLTSFAHTSPAKYLPNFGLGEISVRYYPPLKRFVLTYCQAETQGCWLRTSVSPWGPWTAEVKFQPNGQSTKWTRALICTGSCPPPTDMDFLTSTNVPIACASCTAGVATITAWDSTNPTSQMGIGTLASPWNQRGNWYGAYQKPFWHDNGNGTVTIYTNVSMFNVYSSDVHSITLTKAGTFIMGNVTIQ